MPGFTRLAVTRLVTGAFAWSSSGKTNDDLVTNLVRDRRLKLPAVEAALRRVDRKMFVLPAERGAAYDDRPLGIGYSATISAPHMHAAALEFLAPSIAEKGSVLDVGCGSGYLLAAFAALGPGVRAHGVEYVPQLAEMADANLRAHDASLLESGRVTVTVGDGWAGLPERAPFDAIHVGAAARSVPKALITQLAPGGVMIIPVGPAGGAQELLRVDKAADGSVSARTLFGVRYVPLVGGDKDEV